MDKMTHEVRLQQWSEIIEAQLASGRSKREWCRENGVSEKQFFCWQRRVRKELYESEKVSLVQGFTNTPALVELPTAFSSGNAAIDAFQPACCDCSRECHSRYSWKHF